MASSEVFNLAILLTVKDAASSGLDRYGAKLRAIGKDGEQALNQIEKIRADLNRDLAIGGVGAAGLSLLKKGVDAAGDYEDALLKLRQAYQENAEFSSYSTEQQEQQIKRIMALASELGGFLEGNSATYAELFTALNKSGIDAEDTLNGVGKAAAYLANVTGAIRNGTGAKLAEDLGSYGKMFDLKGDEYMKVVQLFSALEDRFNIGSGSLIEASKYFFSTAKGTMDLRGIGGATETAQLFAFMKRYAGREGSEAGTSLDAIITQYTAHQEKAKKLAKETGIELNFFDSKGKFQGVENMFSQLEKLRTLAPAKRGDWLNYIFGEQGARVASAMVEQGVQGWRNIATEANKSVDVNTKIVQQMDTYNAKVEALSGSWTNFKATAFTPLMEDAKKFIDYGSGIVNTLQSVSAENPNLTGTLTTLAAYGSTALVVYSAIKTLTTGVRLFSIASKFSRGEGFISYLDETKRAADSASSSVASATGKVGGFKNTLKGIASSSAFKIGFEVVGIAAAEFALTSFVQKMSELSEQSRQLAENSKTLTNIYDDMMGRLLLYNAPGDYGGHKDSYDLLANQFLESAKMGRELKLAFNPEQATLWERWNFKMPYGVDLSNPFSNEKFKPDAAAKTWREAGLTMPLQDPNVLARLLVKLESGGGDLNLNLGQVELFKQALEKVAGKDDMRIASELARKELYGEKKPEVAQKSITDVINQLRQNPFSPLKNNEQNPLFQQKPFELKPFDFSKPAETFISTFGNLTPPVNNTIQLFGNLQTTGGDVQQSMLRITQTTDTTQQSFEELLKPTQRLPQSFTDISNSANSLVSSLNSVSGKLANWQPPTPKYETFPYPFPTGNTINNQSGGVGGIISVPSKATGGTVLSDGFVYVHSGEDIVPADVTRRYRNPKSATGNLGKLFPESDGLGKIGQSSLGIKETEIIRERGDTSVTMHAPLTVTIQGNVTEKDKDEFVNKLYEHSKHLERILARQMELGRIRA